MKQYLLSILCFFLFTLVQGQDHSVAREWNERVLYAISADFARPTVHARNLFHTSIAMYDSWMAYQPDGNTYLLGKNLGTYQSSFKGVEIPDNISSARNETISFAVYRIIEHRYSQSPGIIAISDSINTLMDSYGYNRFNTSTDYVNGGPAELGNYIAQQILEFGYTDGSNEIGDYENEYYVPVNPPIEVEEPGNPDIIFPNRWQQISLSQSIDQSGEIVENAPPFLSPEWGNVLPFAMTSDDVTIKNRDGNDYKIYHDPGDPAYIDTTDPSGLESFYKWNFALVPVWQSHLDINDNVIWDVSPNSVGNIQSYPETQEQYQAFYNFFDGGDPSQGYDLNPVTGQPYEPQMINRADYARVLAEFWADGPESVTPPGHWFKIYNEVSDHPLFERKWKGIGEELSNLEYDIKAYFTIGGAMHDAAIAAWSIKGFYDYLRPVSAVRFMADRGQCTDSDLPNYHPAGLPLIPGYIELVEIGDPLAGLANQHAGKIKLYTWRGPDYIENSATDEAGVGWILAENWWPYQRPSFVTPPFAGYVSGHSTYSRTAAEVMTLMTGSEYFPGGMSGFEVEENEFLVFEEGPSETFQLQWAKYIDASDQCSLSRIWGGIHPPVDDIPGRKIGMELGPEVFNYSDTHLSEKRPYVEAVLYDIENINEENINQSFSIKFTFDQAMDQSIDPELNFENAEVLNSLSIINSFWTAENEFNVVIEVQDYEIENVSTSFSLNGGANLNGDIQNPFLDANPINLDTKKPEVANSVYNTNLINDSFTQNENFVIEIQFSESCSPESTPSFSLTGDENLDDAFSYSSDLSSWLTESTFQAVFELFDTNQEIPELSLEVTGISDISGNQIDGVVNTSGVVLDTKNPIATSVILNESLINIQDIGVTNLIVEIDFDDEMDTDFEPELLFSNDLIANGNLELIEVNTQWTSDFSVQLTYAIQNIESEAFGVDIGLDLFQDASGNHLENPVFEDVFDFDTKRPEVEEINLEAEIISDLYVNDGYGVEVTFSEPMEEGQDALVLLSADGIAGSVINDFIQSEWIDATTYKAIFNVIDLNVEVEDIDISVDFALDGAGNSQNGYSINDILSLDTKNPSILSVSSTDYYIVPSDIGPESFEIIAVFDEEMDENSEFEVNFTPSLVNEIVQLNQEQTFWANEFTGILVFDVLESTETILDVGLEISECSDIAQNLLTPQLFPDFLTIDLNVLSVNGIESSDSGFSVYPTLLSSGDELIIRSEERVISAELRVFTVQGSEIFKIQDLSIEPGENSFLLPNVNKGVYFVNLSFDNFQFNQKVIVK